MHRIDGVILNPYSRGGAGKTLWRDLLTSDWARTVGLAKAQVFDGPDARDGQDADRLLPQLKAWAKSRVEQGSERFLAVGGDGTVNLAVNALDGLPIRLGAVGLGSSNDFQKPFRSQGRTQIGNLNCRVEFDEAFAHDLGQVDYSLENPQSTLFAVNASLGFTAEANASFNTPSPTFRAIKRVSTDGAILLAALNEFRKFRRFEVEASWEGSPFESFQFMGLGIVKNPCFAASFRYDQVQAPDDGWFGVHISAPQTRLDLLKVLSGLSRGQFSGTPGSSSQQCKAIAIRARQPLALETDGEVRQVTEARFQVLPQRMLLCP